MPKNSSLGEDVLVVVPTYNERDNVKEFAKQIRKHVPRADVLFVDDASPDGTADVVKELARTIPGLHLMQRTGKRGLGVSYQAGFLWGLERGYSKIVQMDADLSHDPADVPRLLMAVDSCDFALGSRYVAGGRIVGWPLRRWLLSRFANLFAKCLFGLHVRDVTAGFRCWRASVLTRMDVSSLRTDGYAFAIETTWRANQLGFQAKEVPVVFRERLRGISKMGLRAALQGLREVSCLILNHWGFSFA